MFWSAEFLDLVANLVPLKDRTDFKVEFNMTDTRWRPKLEKNMSFSKMIKLT